jgi:hypothetical protein
MRHLADLATNQVGSEPVSILHYSCCGMPLLSAQPGSACSVVHYCLYLVPIGAPVFHRRKGTKHMYVFA